MDPELAEFSYWTAAANWVAWRDDFEFVGNLSELPILQHSDRFRLFLSQYNLMRYSTLEIRELMRQEIVTYRNLDAAVRVPGGAGVDDISIDLAGFHQNARVERSLFSKIFSFARPSTFVAWDSFARRGVAILVNGPRGGRYASYARYLHDFDAAFQGELGGQVSAFVMKKTIPTDQREAFARRVFDVYAMILGGRWATQIGL